MSKTITDEKKIDELLERGVESVLPDKKSLKNLLMSGKRIRLYQGFDPTGTVLHIGHLAGLRKLRQFQDLGHEVIFLIGDGTGQAGDPSGKTTAREKYFTQKELKKNAKDYVKQARRVVRFSGANKARIMFNSKWLNKLTLPDILNIAENFSLQQLSERDIFRRRIKSGESINLREFIYPLLQGYDSVAMKVDLEIGGSDQMFNMLTGRTLVKRYLDKEKFVLTIPLITDSSGKKIGKTEGNVIGITDDPANLFGGIMSLSDDVIKPMLKNLTSVPDSTIEELMSKNPKDAKTRVALEIVRDLNGSEAADKAQAEFNSVFGQRELPTNIESITAVKGNLLQDIVVKAGLVSSNSQFSRLVDQGAVKIVGGDEAVIDDSKYKIEEPITIKIGKKRFLKIEI